MGTRSGADGMRISLLGRFCVSVGPRAIEDDGWRLRKAKSIVKLLALAPGHRLHREQVLSLLWPDLQPDAAANNLHQAMHMARRALGPAASADDARGILSIRDEVVVLEPIPPLWVDAEAFERAAKRAIGTSNAAAHEEAVRLYA